MNELKVICPLTQKTLEKSCPICNFVVKYNDKIIGCAIRRNVRNMIENTNSTKDTLDSFISFKKNMHSYGKN